MKLKDFLEIVQKIKTVSDDTEILIDNMETVLSKVSTVESKGRVYLYFTSKQVEKIVSSRTLTYENETEKVKRESSGKEIGVLINCGNFIDKLQGLMAVVKIDEAGEISFYYKTGTIIFNELNKDTFTKRLKQALEQAPEISGYAISEDYPTMPAKITKIMDTEPENITTPEFKEKALS